MTSRECSSKSSKSPSSCRSVALHCSRKLCARCNAASISQSSSFSLRSSSFFSCLFICVRKNMYMKPVVPVIMAGTSKACMPMAECRKAPRMVPIRKPRKMGISTRSLLASSTRSARSISVGDLRRLQLLLKMIIAALPAVEPMSVAVPVTCVVRTMAPKCMVHMAFCRPHAMAAKQPAVMASACVTFTSSTGFAGATNAATTSKQQLPSKATP
mmetsp:Transcript_104028/g.289840  ORF Transcript_104028/g.289840 Transcript_104028/m.289840 type:complete len:214 (-) Transcript_104028:659-1300(-)